MQNTKTILVRLCKFQERTLQGECEKSYHQSPWQDLSSLGEKESEPTLHLHQMLPKQKDRRPRTQTSPRNLPHKKLLHGNVQSVERWLDINRGCDATNERNAEGQLQLKKSKKKKFKTESRKRTVFEPWTSLNVASMINSSTMTRILITK